MIYEAQQQHKRSSTTVCSVNNTTAPFLPFQNKTEVRRCSFNVLPPHEEDSDIPCHYLSLQQHQSCWQIKGRTLWHIRFSQQYCNKCCNTHTHTHKNTHACSNVTNYSLVSIILFLCHHCIPYKLCKCIVLMFSSCIICHHSSALIMKSYQLL